MEASVYIIDGYIKYTVNEQIYKFIIMFIFINVFFITWINNHAYITEPTILKYIVYR